MGVDLDEDVARARLEALFVAHYGDLVRYATRRVGPDAAGDVVSGTFLIAWRRLADIPTAHARPWLYATARRVIANELRGQRRREQLQLRALTERAGGVGDHAGLIAERLQVAEVLAALSAADQEVLRLTVWDGLDLDEAAAALGCSRTAVKVRLHRARKRFTRLLAAQDTRPTARAALSEGTLS